MDGWMSLSLHFLVSKTEIILEPPSQSHSEDEVRKPRTDLVQRESNNDKRHGGCIMQPHHVPGTLQRASLSRPHGAQHTPSLSLALLRVAGAGCDVPSSYFLIQVTLPSDL